MRVLVAPYNADWVAWFEDERAVLQRALSSWLSGDVQHVGSTSIPGMPSKPIIDMVAGVDDVGRALTAINPLTGLGYVHTAHRPRALYFYRTPAVDGQAAHTFHLHLTEPGSDLWDERLTFRDALRADPVLAERYRDLKRRLADRYPDDITAYTQGKRIFVAAVLAKAGIVL
jgi:GrpB-like predicted nucleotidyltransferase (UPF0157 family)